MVFKSIVSRNIPSERVTDEVKIFKAHPLSPFLNVADKIVNSLLGTKLLSIKIIGSAATSHANNVTEYDLILPGEVWEHLVVEGPRSSVSMNPNYLGEVIPPTDIGSDCHWFAEVFVNLYIFLSYVFSWNTRTFQELKFIIRVIFLVKDIA